MFYIKCFKKSVYFILFIFLFSCTNHGNKESLPTVGTLITPYFEFLKEIGEPYIQVVNVLEPNQMEESVDISAKKMKAIANAQAYFSFGFPLDEILEQKAIVSKEAFIHFDKLLPVYEFSKTSVIPIEDKNHPESSLNELDPHIWMSPSYMILMINKAQEVFAQIVPEQKDTFKQRADLIIEKIKTVYDQLMITAKNRKQKRILIYHPSLGYFAKDLGLTQVAMESEGKEISLKELNVIIDLIKKESLTPLFLQSQYSQDVVSVLKKETGIQVASINPLSSSYIKELEKLNEFLK